MYLNLHALPALIACLLSVSLGIYVFYKNPKNIQNKVFVLFILFVVVFSISEVMLRLSSNSEEGLLWGRIGYLGVIFAPLSLLHLSFVFPRERTIFARNKYALFGLYLIGIVILCVFNLIISVQDVQLSEWGYRVSLSSRFYFIGLWCLITGIYMVFNFFYGSIQSKTTIERKQVRYIFYGGFVVVILSFGTNVIPPMFGVVVFPLSSVSHSIFAFFAGAAVLKYNLFRFKPMVEPTTEKKKAGPRSYRLKSSMGYIVQDARGEQGFEIFRDQITHGGSGLCITKYPPQGIREKYGFEKTPLFWFTFKKSDKEKVVNPQKLDVDLIPQVEDFVKKGKNTMVYMDCFDQITLVKGFDNTLTLINDIRNICRENNSILLLSVNPEIFNKEQLSFFEKSFLEVK
jgi:hypothetical protein